jgi:hypothetical protein
MVMKNVQIKVHFMEVSSKMVMKKGEEEAEGTSSANIHSQPSSLLPPLEPEEAGEIEPLRSKVRHKWWYMNILV